ncbi:GNAT family N-acetyltransferase [Haloarcula laminariae]|uniref:GNAT family N-acetyltransferase n=1 Tax=Haloarcula laminariae TaxID=2961577 RepID=UPI002404C473|nr:GNAT family N-acetyltransferase [Halomicroarcula sp. FL173]
MVELWRLTRNRYGRACYDRLQAMGVTATVMTEYVAALSGEPGAADGGSPTVEACDPDRVTPLDAPTDDLVDGETVLAAFDGATPLGYLFYSVDATHHIHPLERDLEFEGAYLRRVYVAPEHRQRGVASALVAAACERARQQDARRATALVARDNVPSRALFEAHGFEAVRDRRYVRVGPFAYRSQPA